MPRILIAECKQEISSFNPVLSHYADFVVNHGDEILTHHRSVRNEIGGALHVFDSLGDIELVPTFSARAITASGTLAAADWNRIAGEFLDCVRPGVDAVYFSLHGAMAAENEVDPEGYLLQEARKILGKQVPVVVSLDLHGILTDRMLQHSNAVVVYHSYPHIDFFETGERAARLLLRILSRQVKPVMARVRVPALVRGDELITETGSVRHVIRAAQALEASKIALSAGMFCGNPFTDVPDLASNSLVVTDSDPELAAREAISLANLFWEHHAKMQVPLTSLDDSISLAHETKGTVILVDAADAPSSGASGDSNAILCRLLETNYRGRAFIPIVDAPAVRAAISAGVGNSVRTTVGGTLDPGRFSPVEIAGDVRMTSDGRFLSERQREMWYAGDTAVIQTGTITLVVTSRPVSLFDRALFYAHGQDPKDFDLVVVKSPHCEYHMFAGWAARLVDVDAPGATSANLRRLGHTKCARPIFPLDDADRVTFTPQAKVFR